MEMTPRENSKQFSYFFKGSRGCRRIDTPHLASPEAPDREDAELLGKKNLRAKKKTQKGRPKGEEPRQRISQLKRKEKQRGFGPASVHGVAVPSKKGRERKRNLRETIGRGKKSAGRRRASGGKNESNSGRANGELKKETAGPTRRDRAALSVTDKGLKKLAFS